MDRRLARPASPPAVAVATERPATELAPRQLLLPMHYLALIAVSALDLIFTHVVLSLGGFEANPIALAVLRAAEFNGLIVYKFTLMTAVILICEFIGRHARPTARRLATWAVAISALPVLWSLLQLSRLA